MTSYKLYDTPIGNIGIAANEEAIIGLTFGMQGISPDWKIDETPLIKKAHAQLSEYFEKRRKTFDLPLSPAGTAFQQRVWQALQQIPYGETRSYGQIAAAVGNPKASRAVGLANNRNPIAIIIPCHRVIGANGSLTGYGGGLDIKDFLLRLEKEK